MPNSIGEVIIDLRRRKFFTPQELADKVGITEGELHLIEKDLANVEGELLEKFAVALDVPSSAILFLIMTKDDIKPEYKEVFDIAKPLMESLLAAMMDEEEIENLSINKLLDQDGK